ncbi:MAG: zinc ribbon domain-containing protein [Aeriscardovia sp.]|nr:zinc ribbon domain-containing protein [Aeriscardovia sp.]
MPFCHKCGYKLDPNDKFCFECGTPVRESDNSKNTGTQSDSKSSETLVEVQKPEPKPVVNQKPAAKPKPKAVKTKGDSTINKKALCIVLSVLGVFLAGVIAFAIYNNPTRAMIRRLKINLHAKEYVFYDNKVTQKEKNDFSKGCYISSYGKYDSNADTRLRHFAEEYYTENYLLNYSELRKIENLIKESETRYVFYRKDGNNDIRTKTVMASIEFKSKDEAFAFFDQMVNTHFGENIIENYRREFYNSDSIYKTYKGTLKGDWMLKDAMDAKIVTINDLDEKVYKRTSSEAYFNYRLNWDILKWGDRVRLENNDAEFIEKYSKQHQGVSAHLLYVKGKQLTYIESYDVYDKEDKLDDLNSLCNALRVDDLSKLDMDINLKKYLLWYRGSKWEPFSSRIDMI